MKKKLVLAITLLILASSLFAEDARALPRMSGRIILEPVYSFVPGYYDNNWSYYSYGDESTKVFSLGFGLDYGLIDWFTIGLRTGWIPWSDTGTGSDINGIQDFFLIAKFQIIGDRAPVKASSLRFAIAPMAIIPLSESPDMSTESLAAGGRLFFDIVPNYFISLNFFGEGIVYPANMPDFYFNLAFEPVITLPLSRGIDLSMGLPVQYHYNDAYSMTNITIGPNLSIFFLDLALPLELTLQYNLPLLGRESYAIHSASLLVKLYYGLTSGAF